MAGVLDKGTYFSDHQMHRFLKVQNVLHMHADGDSTKFEALKDDMVRVCDNLRASKRLQAMASEALCEVLCDEQKYVRFNALTVLHEVCLQKSKPRLLKALLVSPLSETSEFSGSQATKPTKPLNKTLVMRTKARLGDIFEAFIGF